MEDSPTKSLVIEAAVIDALRTCYDPEIPVDIYELGLIYDVSVEPSGAVRIRMTLTTPACPAAQSLPSEVEAKVKAVPGVTDTSVEVVWDPPWDPGKMSDAARLQLGMM
jgi:FeS assembly SUF system protein